MDYFLKNKIYSFLDYECEKLDVETGKWTKCGSSPTPSFDIKGLIPGKEYKFRVKACKYFSMFKSETFSKDFIFYFETKFTKVTLKETLNHLRQNIA